MNSTLEYINSYDFPIVYIKLYGSSNKYSGGHTNELPELIEFIKFKNISKKQTIFDKLKTQDTVSQYIYFNNIETDLNDRRYRPAVDIIQSNSENKTKSKIETKSKIKSDTKSEIFDIENNINVDTEDKELESDSESKINNKYSNIDDKTIQSSIDDYETETENTNMPSSVFDGKCVYMLLELLDKN